MGANGHQCDKTTASTRIRAEKNGSAVGVRAEKAAPTTWIRIKETSPATGVCAERTGTEKQAWRHRRDCILTGRYGPNGYKRY